MWQSGCYIFADRNIVSTNYLITRNVNFSLTGVINYSRRIFEHRLLIQILHNNWGVSYLCIRVYFMSKSKHESELRSKPVYSCLYIITFLRRIPSNTLRAADFINYKWDNDSKYVVNNDKIHWYEIIYMIFVVSMKIILQNNL